MSKLITIEYDEYLNLLKTHKQICNDVYSNFYKLLNKYKEDNPNTEIDGLINCLANYIKLRIDNEKEPIN